MHEKDLQSSQLVTYKEKENENENENGILIYIYTKERELTLIIPLLRDGNVQKQKKE